jgi:hypothetical protein
MKTYKILIAESVFAKDFYKNNREGQVVEAIAHVLHWQSEYKIALDKSHLCKAIKVAAQDGYDIFHISCHGDADGIQLTDETEVSWDDLADCFQGLNHIPKALVISSCVGGDSGVAHAFRSKKLRPTVIFGAEAQDPNEITFSGACISWPILYTLLARTGLTPEAFKEAVAKMNLITKHEFVYRRWQDGKYRRYPVRSQSK